MAKEVLLRAVKIFSENLHLLEDKPNGNGL
jgi:hypothetical protein